MMGLSSLANSVYFSTKFFVCLFVVIGAVLHAFCVFINLVTFPLLNSDFILSILQAMVIDKSPLFYFMI